MRESVKTSISHASRGCSTCILVYTTNRSWIWARADGGGVLRVAVSVQNVYVMIVDSVETAKTKRSLVDRELKSKSVC